MRSMAVLLVGITMAILFVMNQLTWGVVVGVVWAFLIGLFIRRES